MKLKVHRVVLMVVDHDGLGDDQVQQEIEAARFANDCINPHVMKMDTVEVDWSDDHPLNNQRTRDKAFDELFSIKITRDR